MDFLVNNDGEQVLITIKGPMEMQTVKVFQNKIAEMETSIQKDMILDMGDVDYIDSTGISILIMLNKQQREKGKALTIRNASQRVKSLLELSSLSDLLRY
jgi:anti-sigma B factor antagonist